ncbi:MAG: peptidoglycan-binding protein [Abditibacteriaceae bacterium]
MRARNVKALQYVLHSKGYKVAIDGYFGAQTQKYVRQFQQARKLHMTGVVEAYTWETLVPLLHRGSQGDAVRAIQILLNWQFKDWNPESVERKPGQIRVDGTYGKVTEKSVRTFQEAISVIQVNGKTDYGTWCCLLGGHLDGE